MPALSAAPAISTNRWVTWLLFAFGGIAILMVAVYILKKGQTGAGGTGSKGSDTANPDGTPSTPPVQPPAPSGPPAPPVIPTPVITPSDNIDPLSVNWDYVKAIAWKTRASIYEGQDFRCEVTNGVIEMGENDLKALILLYKKYYNGFFQSDYCTNWKSSGCTFAWFESKHETACERLKKYNF